MKPLEALFEAGGLPSYQIPSQLELLYGGSLGFGSPRLYANFVSSLDGVVALEGVEHSSQMIAAKSEADRFVMGLLRACADAVLIGAGTLRAAPGSLWTPAYIFPDAAAGFARLRETLGREDEPRLVVLTASGEVDAGHRALEAGALVLTTESGASNLGHRLPSASTVLPLGGDRAIDPSEVVGALHGEGHEVVLSEGGPTVIGGLLQARLLDELFLTVSPVLAGRSPDSGRPGLVEGIDLLPSQTIAGNLTSLRRHGSHLFLRYTISN